MKKFLVILMVVAMASFLFVGCLPAVTPDVDEDVDEDVDVGVKTDTPFITATGFDFLATTTQYITAIGTVSVDGVGVAGAIIKLYVDDVYVGIGSTGIGGAFSGILVTGATVIEGAKKLYVTATVPGLAESDKSTEYAFTYDKTKPTILSVVGDSSSSYITVTFSEPVDADTVVDATWLYGAGTNIAYAVAGATPSAIAASSSTTAILYEVAAPTAGVDELETAVFLTVSCTTTAVADLAGNLMVIPVTVLGTVVE